MTYTRRTRNLRGGRNEGGNYWVDLTARRIFCLVEAPDAQAAHDCHLNAHGHVADEIYEVVQG